MATSLATLGVRINATEALIGLKRLDHRLKGVGLSSSQVGAKLVKFGKIAGAALGGLAIMSIKTAANFESSMNKVSAIGGHTGKALLALENQARDLGKSTVFSASEAADGMTFLAMAGFDAQQTMAAMPAVLDLAAASSTDLATSADIASNILSGLGLGANKTGKLVDVMAKATSSANMNVIELGEAMKMSSPLAKTAGLTMEGMTAILGKMADAGIKGSLAGTALKAGIAKLLKPTAEMTEMLDGMGVSINNTDGSMRNFIDILQDLEQSGAGATEFVTIFGQRAGPQLMAALTQGVDGIKGLRTELQNAGGTAKKMADTQLKGLNGALKKLNSAWEELQIKFAKTGVLTALTEKVDELTEALGKEETIERIKAFGRGVLSVGSAMKTVFDAFMALPAWIREVGVVLAFLGGKKAKLVLAGITALSWGIGKIGDAIASVGDEAESAMPKLEKFSAFQRFPSIKPFIKDDTPIKKPKSMGLSDEDTVLAKRLNSARQTIKTVGEYKDSIAELGVEMTAQARVGKEFEKHKEDVIATMKAAGQSETFQTSQIEAMTSAYESAIVRMEELDIANKVKALTDSMADSITGMIMNIGNGANSLKDTVKDMARVVLAEFVKIKVAQPMAQAMAGAFNFSDIFREHGGTVTGNKPFVVGEAGAEIFVPNKTGTIIPHDALASGGSSSGETNVNVSFNITANDTTGFDELLDSRRGMIVGIINQAMNDRGMTGVTA